MTRPSTLTCSDPVLVRRARYGDRRAARRLASRHLERISLLATVVGVSQARSAALAREGFALALQARGPFPSALLTAFAGLARAEGEQAQGRLLVLLVDLEHRPQAAAAELLGLTYDEAEERRLLVGSISGALAGGKSCRGWGLASGRKDLTAAERTAGDSHRELCRKCRERRAQLDREHRELLVRAAGVAGALGAGQLAAITLAPAAGGLLAGKAAAGVIGALGATALATGSLVAAGAVPLTTPPRPVVSPPAQQAPAWPTCGSACAVPPPTGGGSLSGSGSGGTTSATPSSPAPSLPGASLPPLVDGPALDVPLVPLLPLPPLPTSWPTTWPTSIPLPLPTALPLPLPSVSPLPLPTELTLLP